MNLGGISRGFTLTISLLPAINYPAAPGPWPCVLCTKCGKSLSRDKQNTPPHSSLSGRRPGSHHPRWGPPPRCTPERVFLASPVVSADNEEVSWAPEEEEQRLLGPQAQAAARNRGQACGPPRSYLGRQERLGQCLLANALPLPPGPPEGRGAACPMPLPHQLWVRRVASVRPKRGPSGGGSSSLTGDVPLPRGLAQALPVSQ